MMTSLCLSPKTLYPITSHDDNFKLISNEQLFSNLISTSDFSRVMSQLQWMKKKKTPLNMMFSIKAKQGIIPVLMYSYYYNDCIYVTLFDLDEMTYDQQKNIQYKKSH